MRGLTLLSGGIDSPVAAYLAVSHGLDIGLLHFDNRPFTERTYIDRVIGLGEVLASRLERRIDLHVVPHGETQAAIGRSCERRYQCVLCRRMMLRTAGRLAGDLGYDLLITGDSIGQVASQTIDNLLVETPASPVPVLRPLIAMDKEDIVRIARDIGTFDLSTRPGVCCMMAPPKPATQARADTISRQEEGLDVGDIVSKSIFGMVTHVLAP